MAKKITSFLTATTLIIGFVLPIGTALAEEDELYKLYLDQAKEYEGNDFGKILDNSAKVLDMTGTHSSCPNFTRYAGKSFDSVESFTAKFREMMGLVSDECMGYINKNLSLVNTKFYGHGQIFDWLNAAYVAIKNNPDVVFVNFDAPPPVDTEEPKEEAIQPVEEVKPEVKEPVVEKIEAPEEEIVEEEVLQPETTEEQVEEVPVEEPIVTEPETQTEENAVSPAEEVIAPQETITAEETTPAETPAETSSEEVEYLPTEADEDENGLPDFFEEMFEVPAATDHTEVDNDNDGLTNAEEYAIGTSPTDSDSDGDGISDTEEIRLGTDPSDEDSDNDLIPDGQEIQGGTNPLSMDSEGNGISDFVRQNTGITAETVITDNNANLIPDQVEEQITQATGIVIENGYQDSDGDGLSDAFEALRGTDIDNRNSIDSELSDDEVLLDYKNVRSRQTDRAALIKSTAKASIVNIKSGEVLLDKKPVFKGTAPDGAIVIFYYQDPETGVALELGKVTSGGGDKFIFQPGTELPLGTHTISVRVYNKAGISIDYVKPIDITIAEEIVGVDTAKTEAPSVESINEVQLTEASLPQVIEESTAIKSEKKELSAAERREKVEKLKLQYEKGRKNTIRGYSAPGSIVEVYWQSLVISSAVIADAETGYYEASPGGELEPGDHTAWLYSVDPTTNVKSKSSKVEFSIGESSEAAVLKLEGNQNLILVVIGALALLGLGGLIVLRRRKGSPTLS